MRKIAFALLIALLLAAPRSMHAAPGETRNDNSVRAKRQQPKQRAQKPQKPRKKPKPTPQQPKVVKLTPAQQAAKTLELAHKTLAYVQKSAPRRAMAAQLVALTKRYNAARANAEALQAVTKELAALRRKIILSHPALDFDQMLVTQNPPPGYSHNCDQYLGRHSRPGPGLTVLDNWKTDPRPTVLLADKLPAGATWKPKLSWDAKRIVFTFCDHTETSKDLRRYFIYEAAVDGSWVRQITGTPHDGLERWGGRKTVLIEDGDPCYLPDGGIAFVSTRIQGFGRCHNGRYTPSLLLHRADPPAGQKSGPANIRQISFAEANETDPVVLPDGRMVFTRWDYINRNVTQFHMLWYTRPDGATQANFYGADTEAPWMVSSTAPIPNSKKVVALATGHHSFSTGCIITIDTTVGENGPDPIKRITPEIPFFEAEAGAIKGSYSTPWPITEDLFLAAYSPDILPKQGRTPSDTFSIYLVDSFGGREFVYKGATSSFSPTPIRPRPRPASRPSALPPVATAPKTGIFAIQDIYKTENDPEGLLKRGQIKTLRINAIVGQPAVWKNQPSLIRHEVAKKILGTVPVQPDGSVVFTAPAETPLQLQALDENGMATMTMRTVVYLQRGEVRSCVGCHEPKGTAPISAAGVMRGTPATITPPESSNYTDGFSFVRSVQPALDRHCIKCHGLGEKLEAGMSLLGTAEKPKLPKGWMQSRLLNATTSYNSLLNRPGMVKAANFKREIHASRPNDYFAAASKLAPMILSGHDKAKLKLDKPSMQRLIDWLDLNIQYAGNYSFNRIEDRQADPAGEKALRAFVKQRFGAKLAAQPFAALVNVGQPDQSRILRAPMPLASGGWGQLDKGYTGAGDPDYARMIKLVEASIAPMQYRDIDGTCGRDPCVCKSCWVRKLVARKANGK